MGKSKESLVEKRSFVCRSNALENLKICLCVVLSISILCCNTAYGKSDKIVRKVPIISSYYQQVNPWSMLHGFMLRYLY